MYKIYHLGTCSTCQRILKTWKPGKEVIRQDIKTERITPAQLDEMARLAGSYEALFSRKAQQFRVLGLHEKGLKESDYRKFLLDEYTFLKRPVLICGQKIFIGNSPAVVESAGKVLHDR